ncbi:MAG: Rieske (2Fe-2S) protein [Kineosporiaceae bacterium]
MHDPDTPSAARPRRGAPPPPSRREALRWVAAAALGGGAAATSGCSGGTPDGPLHAVPAVNPPDDGSGELAPASTLQAGAAMIVGVDGEALALARLGATDDTVVAFDATCPHQDCVVTVRHGVWHCPCHDSDFDAATGARLRGPAPTGLSPRAVSVRDGRIVLDG